LNQKIPVFAFPIYKAHEGPGTAARTAASVFTGGFSRGRSNPVKPSQTFQISGAGAGRLETGRLPFNPTESNLFMKRRLSIKQLKFGIRESLPN